VQQPQLPHRHTSLGQSVAALVALPYALGLACGDGAAIGVEGIHIDRCRQCQRAFGHHIEAFRLAVRILEPEYLGERDRLALSRYSTPWDGLTSTGPSRLSS
jgi:hypothetical protein